MLKRIIFILLVCGVACILTSCTKERGKGDSDKGSSVSAGFEGDSSGEIHTPWLPFD